MNEAGPSKTRIWKILFWIGLCSIGAFAIFFGSDKGREVALKGACGGATMTTVGAMVIAFKSWRQTHSVSRDSPTETEGARRYQRFLELDAVQRERYTNGLKPEEQEQLRRDKHAYYRISNT